MFRIEKGEWGKRLARLRSDDERKGSRYSVAIADRILNADVTSQETHTSARLHQPLSNLVAPFCLEMLENLNRQLLSSDGQVGDMIVELFLTVPLWLADSGFL